MGVGVELGELVSLLSKVAPEQLDSIRRKFPDQTRALSPGQLLGDGPSTNVGCVVALDALNTYAPLADGLRIKIRERLAWSLRFDLLAKFAAACGSGGAVGVLATGVGTDKAIIASVVALIGSVGGLLFSYLQRDETAGSVTDSYNLLIRSLVDSGELLRSLPMLCNAGQSKELQEALNRANETARNLNTLILRYK